MLIASPALPLPLSPSLPPSLCSLFVASLPADERQYLESHIGLGNSQKAEVAWLDMRYKKTGDVGYLYEEIDVCDFRGAEQLSFDSQGSRRTTTSTMSSGSSSGSGGGRRFWPRRS